MEAFAWAFSEYNMKMNRKNKLFIIISTFLFSIIGGLALSYASENTVTITGAYMFDGFLYVRGDNLPDRLDVYQHINNDGETIDGAENALSDSLVGKKLSLVKKTGENNSFGFAQYALYSNDYGYDEEHKNIEEMIMFGDGKYVIGYEEKGYPVVSVINYRVDSGKIADNGNKIPFNDYVYPIIFNNDVYEDICFDINSTKESLDSDNWPLILKNGVKEEKKSSQGEYLQVAYEKESNNNEPIVYYDEIPNSNQNMNLKSLDQNDKLTLLIDKDTADIRFWDQISKIWYEDRSDNSSINMVYVNGGTYKAGDWRGDVLSYDENQSKPVNIKKLWLSMLDPQYMGESKKGKNALGVTGLSYENSLANEPEDTDMWITNEDATDIHDVSVSDFMIGQFEVTMKQFYDFVDNTEIVSNTKLKYSIDGKEYYINEIASRSMYYKKDTVRDNGWGMNSRAAIDINWYEAVEFCNYWSLKEGLTPCYSFTNIYNGEEKDGKTSITYLEEYTGSVMQKQAYKNTDIQLVKVKCDFLKNGYRLPTESEYEYAARGGDNISQLSGGNGYLYSGTQTVALTDETNADNTNYYLWKRTNVEIPQKSGEAASDLFLYNVGSNGYSCPVGSRLPNVLGIYDLSGNVWEACFDYYNRTYYETLKNANQVAVNPTGPEYSNEQISIFNKYIVDSSMFGEFQYTYQLENDGTNTRVGAINLGYSGKLSHTLRGGCFTNPDTLVATVNRYAPSQTFTQNCINFTDSRVGFRVAKTVTVEESNNKLNDLEEDKINTNIEKLLKMFSSKKDYSSEIADLLCETKSVKIQNVSLENNEKIENWIKSFDRTKYRYNDITNIISSKTDYGYTSKVYVKYYNSTDVSVSDACECAYDIEFITDNEELNINKLTLSVSDESIGCVTGHCYDNGVIKKGPTYSEKGKKTYTCLVCGETYDVVLDYTSIDDIYSKINVNINGENYEKDGNKYKEKVTININLSDIYEGIEEAKYQINSQNSVEIKTENINIVVDEVGSYSLKLSVEDKSGQVTEKTYKFQVVNGDNTIIKPTENTKVNEKGKDKVSNNDANTGDTTGNLIILVLALGLSFIGISIFSVFLYKKYIINKKTKEV